MTSDKTLNTLTDARLKDPKQVYSSLKRRIDELADFKDGRVGTFIIEADEVKSKELQLGIPAGTTAEQWAQIKRAIDYAQSQGIDLIVTVIRP